MKRLGAILILLAAGGFFGRDMDRYRPAGLVAGYSFNDASGRDASGNGHTLVAYGNGSYASGYVTVDGSDYYTIGTYVLPNGSGDPYSISIWIYPTSFFASGYTTVLATNREQGNAYGAILGAWMGGSMAWKTNLSGSSVTVSFGWTLSSNLNAWHHLVVTSDGSTIRTYHNGEAKNTGTPIGYVAFGSERFTLFNSASYGAANAKFTGSADGLAVFNRALTSAEISQIYNAGKSLIAQRGYP